MEPVTAEQVRAAAHDHSIKRWDWLDCSICRHPIGWRIDGEEVAYSSHCNCGGWSAPQPSSWDDLAHSFNMQKPKVRARLWGEFLAASTALAEAVR
jgi:hypothetical protein